MNKLSTLQSERISGRYLRLLIIVPFTVCLSAWCCPPKDTPRDDTKAWKIIATYTNTQKDVTAAMLADVGFAPPAELKSKWKALPAVKKLDIAYCAAERKHNGRKMLVLLVNKLSEKYESVPAEDAFKALLGDNTGKRKKVKFKKRFTTGGTASLPVRDIILAITKYTDRGALGGTLGMLSDYGKLPADTIYNILLRSRNNQEALLDGARLFALNNNPVLDKVVRTLDNSNYSAVTYDEIRQRGPASKRMRMPAGPKIGNSNSAALKAASDKYRKYLDTNTSASSLSFDSMIINRDKWGGVILGNKVSGGSLQHTPPEYIVWLADEKKTGEPATGTLEFKLSGRQQRLLMPGVFLEDVYAAYKILFDTQDTLVPHVKNGNGLGLINAIGRTEHKIDIHPAIANTELGRSIARADVWPRVRESIKPLLQASNQPTPEHLAIANKLASIGSSAGWKFFAAPLVVTDNNGFINAVNADTTYADYALQFQYRERELKVFFPYNAGIPLLCNSLEDYARLNTFAKLFAILQWAKEADARFYNKPETPQLTTAPEIIRISNGLLTTY